MDCLQILHACLHARQKTERFLPLIYVLLEKLFVNFCVFVNSYMRLRSDRCVIKDNLYKRVEINMPRILTNFAFKCVFRQMITV